MDKTLGFEAGEISIDKNIIKWRIKDIFSYFLGNDFEAIDSPEFSISSTVCFFNMEENDQDKRYIGAYLFTKDQSTPQVAHFTLGVERADGTVDEKNETTCYLKELFNSRIGGFGAPNFLKKSKLKKRKEELAPSDELTITCCLRVYNPSAGVDHLLQNLELLFQQGQDSDIVLKVENREFAMHKSILRIRSPVFASMFHQDMIENKSVVDIPDCTAEAFELVLRFMYTGSVSTISINNVFDLYYAADKYQVDDLKQDCVVFMIQNFSVDTFCDIITLSSRHHESDLQEVATCFFCSNIKNIVKTAKWKRYIQDNPLESNELYVKAIQA